MWARDVEPRKALERRKVRDWIAEYAAAFANADGGTLVLGVDDDGTPSGHGYPAEAVDEFLTVPEKRLRPAVPCRTGRIGLDGHELLVFEVPMSLEAVMVEGNGFPYRVGDQVRREPQEVINERKEVHRRVGFEQRFRHDASLEDIDLELVARFFAGSPFARRSAEEILEHFDLIEPRTGGWGITNAALLLFARPPLTRWHPRAGLRFFRVQGTERRHGAQRNVTQGPRVEKVPLAEAIAAAHRLAEQQIGRSEKLHGLLFRETPEYPRFAWQEAIVNAFAHRDYEIQGLEIEVWFYSDRMEIRSPGELVPPVTLDDLQSGEPVHASRNPLVVRVLAEAGLMRDEGEGVSRIFAALNQVDRDEAYRQIQDLVSLRIVRAAERAGPGAVYRVAEDLHDRLEFLRQRLPAVRAFFSVTARLTNADYRALFGLTRHASRHELQRLVEQGFLRLEGEGRGAGY